MAQSINLIPQEEKVQQRKVKIVKASSVVSVLILLIVTGVAGYFWYRINGIKEAIAAQELEIQKSRTDIGALSEIEVKARNLDGKFKILSEFFAAERNYSILLKELNKRVPQGSVTVTSFTLTGNNKSQISLSGEGIDYISIARFIDTLSDDDFEDAGEGLEHLFTNVTLNSVNLDNQDLSVGYFILLDYDPSLLK